MKQEQLQILANGKQKLKKLKKACSKLLKSVILGFIGVNVFPPIADLHLLKSSTKLA